MTLQEALSQIHGPVGQTTLIAGILDGDLSSAKRREIVGTSLKDARDHLEAVRKAQSECKSDYAFWGYEGEKAAWEAAVKILEAAEIVGPDDLPDVPLEMGGGVVMDECAKLDRWSAEVLRLAKHREAAAH